MLLKRLIVIAVIALILVECRRWRMRYKLGPNDEWVKINHAGLERKYLLHKPRQAKQPMLLMVLHGGGGKAENTPGLAKRRFLQLSDAFGFYVVYPQGHKKQWNDGRIVKGSYAHENKLDDVGFLRAVIAQVKKRFHLKKVYLTGMSNGGFMSFFMACKASDVIDGIAPVTATIAKANASCNPKRPLPVLLINGTSDTLVPYEGGYVKVLGRKRGAILSTKATIARLQEINGCANTQAELQKLNSNSEDGSFVEKFVYRSCKPRITLYKVVNGGHTWPGGFQYLPEAIIGKTNQDINAADEIYGFFKDL